MRAPGVGRSGSISGRIEGCGEEFMRESDRLGAVEAILFVASAPVTGQQVADALEGELDANEAMSLMEALQSRYEHESVGLRIERVAEGFRLVTRPSHAPFVRNFLKAQNLRKLTPASVETLAIVAYKQPITTAEVGAVRGTESGAVLKGLLDKKLIRIAGRRNVVGKPLLYATTKEFLVHFGLNSLDDLPSFREIEEVFRENVRQESLFKETEPAESTAPADGAPLSEPVLEEEFIEEAAPEDTAPEETPTEEPPTEDAPAQVSGEEDSDVQ
jgi:segregation and condensation protein B